MNKVYFNWYTSLIQREFKINFKQWMGVITLIFVIILINFISLNSNKENKLIISSDLAFKSSNNRFNTSLKEYKKFNPNTISNQEWIGMGFTEKQVYSILKYKSYLGGSFSSKQQLKECYVISEKQYNKIKQFILLPATSIKKTNFKKELPNVEVENNYQITYQKFNPNNYQLNDWIKIGFSEKQANSILKYKQFLGGKFISKDQIKKCYVIDNERYNQIEGYLEFPQNKIQTLDLNTTKMEEFVLLGFNSQMATRIINYRNALGGFVNKEQLKEVYGINIDFLNKINQQLIIESEANKIHLNTLEDDKVLFKHPYFRKIATKIIQLKKEKGRVGIDDIINFCHQSNLDASLIKLYLQIN